MRGNDHPSVRISSLEGEGEEICLRCKKHPPEASDGKLCISCIAENERQQEIQDYHMDLAADRDQSLQDALAEEETYGEFE